MPSEPNSLTTSAVPRPSGDSRKRRTRVVLPAPRKPVTIVTGSREPRSRFCRRPKRVCDVEGNRSKMVSDMDEILHQKKTKPARYDAPAFIWIALQPAAP